MDFNLQAWLDHNNDLRRRPGSYGHGKRRAAPYEDLARA
jgi:hypothetical protein